ncbi:MAG: hypothetical protein ACRDI2_15305 [Chloroflexota bacterium]
MMGRIRVAIVGCGGMGRTHARTLAGLADAEVKLLVDPSAEAVGRLRP